MYKSAEQLQANPELTISEQPNFEVPDTFPKDWNYQFNQRERYKDDTETWLAEVLDGNMRTHFEYSCDGQDLYSQDGGAVGKIFDDAIEAAQIITKENPSLLFELRRRVIEKGEYEDMLAMAKGELLDENNEQANTIIAISDFPPELMRSSEDIGGYNANRKQTMMRVITRNADGKIGMTTQSLDGTNRQALEAIYKKFGVEPKDGELLGQRIIINIPDELHGDIVDAATDTYDENLKEQYGGEWQAGIRGGQNTDTYKFVKAQTDLVEMFVQAKMQSSETAEKLRYGLAATVTRRWKEFLNGRRGIDYDSYVNQSTSNAVMQHNLIQEFTRATLQAEASGQVFSGCGASVGASGGASSELSQSGYGNKSGEDEYGPLTFKCTAGHTNTRPKGKLISKCSTKDCKGTVGC